MMAQNAVARATAPAGGAGIGCWSFQTPGPVSSRSSGAKADGGFQEPSRSGIATGTGPIGRRTPVAAGRVQPSLRLTPLELRPLPSAPALQIPLPSRSGIATGTGPIGRRTPVAAGRVQRLTPLELRPLPSAPALQIPELLPSPVLQSACQCGRSSARCQATPPAPARILPPTSRGAACSGSTPPLSRSARRAGSRSRAHAGVRPGAPRSAPGASRAPAPSGSPSLARAQLCRSGAPHPWPSYSHMDAIWTPQRISSPYTAIDLAVKYLLFMHLPQCPARDSNPEPTD